MVIGQNVQRLLIGSGLSLEEAARQCGLAVRTLKLLIEGQAKPHTRTLHKLAQGLGVAVETLLCPPPGNPQQALDQRTNPRVAQVLAGRPHLCADWQADDYAELYSQFGVGGPLTESGVLQAAERINFKRQVHHKVELLLESGQSELLAGFVELLLARVRVRSGVASLSPPAAAPDDWPRLQRPAAPAAPRRLQPSCAE